MRTENEKHLKTCPGCGAAINSYTAFCPYCGHEFEVVDDDNTDSVQEFEEKLERLDEVILKDPKTKDGGFSSWSAGGKAAWIIFTLMFFGFPLVIYWAVMLVRMRKTPPLTKKEEQKAATIENYVVPSERKSILDLLLLIRTKLAFIADGSLTRKSTYWGQIWSTKADLVIHSAEILIPDDAIAGSTIREIRANQKKLKNKMTVRTLLGVLILAGVIWLFIWAGQEGSNHHYGEKTDFWPDTRIASLIPGPGAEEYIVSLDNVDYLSVYVEDYTTGKFEKYVEACKNAGFTVDGDLSGSSYSAYNEEGYSLYLSFYDKEMYVSLQSPEELTEITWPQKGLGALLPEPAELYGILEHEDRDSFRATLGHMDHASFSDYADACIEAGFDVDYSKNSDYFSGKNADGLKLYMNYEGFGKVSISLYKP